MCGYCGEVFASRSKLFRHLREANSCRTIALSHGMPLENPIKAVERRLRRRYGDLLLAGCIVLRVKPGFDHDPSRKASFYKSPRGLLLRSHQDETDEVRDAPYDVVVVRVRKASRNRAFPKARSNPSIGPYSPQLYGRRGRRPGSPRINSGRCRTPPRPRRTRRRA